MGNGKRGIAPCGHPGEHVVGNYVRCDLGCDTSDGAPIELIDPEETLPLCIHCGSSDVERWPDLWANGDTLYVCHACGRSGRV